jgi:hypothetical protein
VKVNGNGKLVERARLEASGTPKPEATTLTMVLAQAAVHYARRGLRVLPLQPRGKVPVFEEWQERATSDPECVESIWERMPTANIGVAMGPGSGIVDFEADDPNAERALQELFDGEFPVCPTFRSSRGVHRLFCYSPRLPHKATHKIGKLDIKIGADGLGSQCVFPPSIHPDGPRYEWLPGLSLDDVDPPEIPETVLRKLEASTRPNAKPQENGACHRHREKIESALASLNPSRADDYDVWLSVGMALHAEDTGLLDLWDRWSQRSAKYKPGECVAKWDSFSATGNGARPVTIATVFKWATDDGWKPTRKDDHATPAQARQRERLRVISSAELATTETEIPYLIDRILVAGLEGDSVVVSDLQLARVVAVWSTLSDAAKGRILGLVTAAERDRSPKEKDGNECYC